MAKKTDSLLIEPDTKVRLTEIDPDQRGKYKNHDDAEADLAANLERLATLQARLYADQKRSLLIVLQGMDGAGKDGTIKHVMTGVNPQGCAVASFKQPTGQELAHDFLWRVHPYAPRRGQISIFNRSHYEDVLVVRVHELAPVKVWSQRYDQINDFERLLVDGNNTVVLKFFLHISKAEQLSRFKKRLDDPERNWKISESDYSERQYWDQYQEAYEDLLKKTSTKAAPWYVIPANHKWYRNLMISKIVADTLDGMKLKLPEPTVDLAEIRKRYHKAASEK